MNVMYAYQVNVMNAYQVMYVKVQCVYDCHEKNKYTESDFFSVK